MFLKEALHSAELAPGERIDDLQLNGLSLIQSADAFRFGTDSVLLAHFAHVNAKEYCVDLGAGAGALSFLLHGRTGCRILGIEIDARQADRFLRSVRLNGLNEAEITAVIHQNRKQSLIVQFATRLIISMIAARFPKRVLQRMTLPLQ